MKASDGHEIYGISGGPIPNFREGWAILPLSGEKPHYWVRHQLSDDYHALCGLKNRRLRVRVSPLAPGVFMAARCGHCQKKRQRQTRFVTR